MLTSAREHYREQQKLTALALRDVRRHSAGGLSRLAQIIGAYQAAAIALTVGWTPAELREQGIHAPAAGRVSAGALLTEPGAVVERMAKAQSEATFDALVVSLVSDAGRTAAAVDMGSRPALTGYVRSLNPPSCPRCAVLAGRVYRYSTGFSRHPGCDCLMTPTVESIGRELTLDGTDAALHGQVTGLSKGDQFALENGADLGQVVNVRRREAGLSIGSSVIERGGRLTPQGVLRIASDRTEAISLLRRFGYIT